MKKWRNFIDEVKKKRKTIACVICVKEKDKILVIKRSKDEETKQGHWDLPGGHVDDEDKSIEKGALRELEEETGLKSTEEDLIYVAKVESDDADKYFYTTSEWSGTIKFKENPKTGVVEHSDSKWVTIDDIKDNKSLELRTFPVYLLNRALEKLNNDQGS
jgi:ADP-ribose pyrophosphatase YjhB (NUDIX family)|tara:strand:- start:2081 stop:2560 length:480 start_codon:yes stop_codon:yes gene_type:complete